VFIVTTASSTDFAADHLDDSLVAVTAISTAEAEYMLDRLALMEVLSREHGVGQYADALHFTGEKYTTYLPPTWFLLDRELWQAMSHNEIVPPAPGRNWGGWVLTEGEAARYGILSHEPSVSSLNLMKDKKHAHGTWMFRRLQDDGGVPPPEATAAFEAECSLPFSQDGGVGVSQMQVRSNLLRADVFQEVLQRCNATKE